MTGISAQETSTGELLAPAKKVSIGGEDLVITAINGEGVLEGGFKRVPSRPSDCRTAEGRHSVNSPPVQSVLELVFRVGQGTSQLVRSRSIVTRVAEAGTGWECRRKRSGREVDEPVRTSFERLCEGETEGGCGVGADRGSGIQPFRPSKYIIQLPINRLRRI